jgi:hypothetical protein
METVTDVRIGAHLRHTGTGKTGTLMGVHRVGEVLHYLVVVDGTQGCGWADYPAGEWERI